MDARQERGLVIAATNKIEQNKLGWKVPSQSGNGSYIVNLDHGEPFCSCPDFEKRHQPCKHIHAVEYVIQRETKPDGTTTVTEAIRVTYNQDWHNYNEAQYNEQEHFVTLLKDLCGGVPQPEYKFGRPRLPLSDVVFGLALKSYTTLSGRRAMSTLRNAETRELVEKCPSFTSNARYLENPELTPLLKSLIGQSALPMRSVEADFAVDSTGFSTSTYSRWFDHKWGKEKSVANWIKAHAMVGTKTHIVTAVEVTPNESADSPQLPTLLERTTQGFNVKELSADKAYSSKRNLEAIEAVGGTGYILYKSNTVPPFGAVNGEIVPMDNSAWARMYHYFAFNRESFLEHYHKRSNVETAFSMIKSKFGTSVRAKTPVAQVNEVLCKILCHNICVLIQSWYELGIEAVFGASCSKSQSVVPEVKQN